MEMVNRSFAVAAMYDSKALCTGMHDNGVTVMVAPANRRGVIASKEFAKGELRLMMFSASIRKATKVGDDTITVKVDGTEIAFTASAPHQPSDDATTNSCVPFWYVQVGTDVNMKFEAIVVKIGNATVNIPCVVNTKKVEKGQSLLLKKVA